MSDNNNYYVTKIIVYVLSEQPLPNCRFPHLHLEDWEDEDGCLVVSSVEEVERISPYEAAVWAIEAGDDPSIYGLKMPEEYRDDET